MIDLGFVWFAFGLGAVAFFSPCAVALLPGYISTFVSRHTEKFGKESQKVFILVKGLQLALFSILGFVTIFGGFGLLITWFGSFLKQYLSMIAISMAVAIIVVGVLMLLGKDFFVNLPRLEKLTNRKTKNESLESYLFGIAYGMGALGCVFPLFLTVLTQAIGSGNIFIGGAYLLSYLVGMSIFMILVSVLTIFAKDMLMKYLFKSLRYFKYASGIILILAGIYTVYYHVQVYL